MLGTSSTCGGRISPYATTTSTSGAWARSASRPGPPLTVSTSNSGSPAMRAAIATSVGLISLPRPAGCGTRVRTRTRRWLDAASARSEGTDQRSFPRNTMPSDRATPWSLRGASALGALHLELAELPHHVPTPLVVEPVDVEHASQVVRLVLEDAREQAL